MANFPKKSKDPTEVALSAIQDALNVREAEQNAAVEVPTTPATAPPAPVAPQVPPETRRRSPIASPTPTAIASAAPNARIDSDRCTQNASVVISIAV